MKKRLLFFVLLFSIVSLASGEDAGSKKILLKGKAALDYGRYAEAVENLNTAYEKLPVIGDYILLWLSKAYVGIGDLSESNLRIKELLKKYPESPIKKKARAQEVRNVASSGTTDNLSVVEAYVRDYPEDNSTKFLFGQMLKNKGQKDRAKAVFKSLYISSNGTIGKMAFNELSPTDITVSDLIEKASNLINAMEYKDAESVLKEAQAKAEDRHKPEISRKLGHSLFKQKKYKESAEVFEKAGDLYWRAFSLYRSGERATFNNILKKLISMEDKRAGTLLLMVASEKRRSGDFAGALTTYKKLRENYPVETENALWGIGWTYYRSADYQNALDVFTELYNTYNSSRYLYWKAKTLENMDKDAEHIYKELGSKKQDFYGLLAQSRRKQDTSEKGAQLMVHNPGRAKNSSPKLHSFRSERVDVLLGLGFRKEAVTELSLMAKKAETLDELISIAFKMSEAEEYRSAIGLISKQPYKEDMHDILYPLAFWQFVRDISQKNNLDPFIVLSVMREESRFDPEARSQTGALGLMQLMPQTAALMDRNVQTREQVYDVKTNITLGTRYINSLLKEFNSLPLTFAAYNAGEDAVRRWQKNGKYKSIDEFIEDIPYDETRNYVKRVLTTYFEYLKFSGGEEMPRIL